MNNYTMKNDREPTITDIKKRLSELNDEINIYANEHIVVSDWSIKSMNKPFYIKKFNSTSYGTNEEKPYQGSGGWWGDSHASSGHNWGRNLFPNDKKAWWIGDSIIERWRFGQEVPESEKRFYYYLYEAPENMTVSIYKIGWWNSLKVNGQPINFTNDAGIPYPGQNGSFHLSEGKNVFEITVTAGIPTSGAIMYVYDQNNNILFRTGDPGWGVSDKPVPDYTLITLNNITNQDKRNSLNDDILFKINDINTLLANIAPKMKDNLNFKDENKGVLLAQFKQLEMTFHQLNEKLKKPLVLEGNYEVSQIKTTGNYSNFILFVLFAIFMVVSLIFIVINPEIGNLDMFMLALALLIVIYYIYEYYTMKKRIGKKTK